MPTLALFIVAAVHFDIPKSKLAPSCMLYAYRDSNIECHPDLRIAAWERRFVFESSGQNQFRQRGKVSAPLFPIFPAPFFSFSLSEWSRVTKEMTDTKGKALGLAHFPTTGSVSKHWGHCANVWGTRKVGSIWRWRPLPAQMKRKIASKRPWGNFHAPGRFIHLQNSGEAVPNLMRVQEKQVIAFGTHVECAYWSEEAECFEDLLKLELCPRERWRLFCSREMAVSDPTTFS